LLTTVSFDLLVSTSLMLGAMTIVPRHLVRREVEAGLMVPIDCPDLSLNYDVALAMRRRGAHSAAMNEFARWLREACADVPRQAHHLPAGARLKVVTPS
jgi:DNA-binding transcriptional LysR family regulator